MKILMVLTSHDKLGDTGRRTGFWLEEFAAPYYVFSDAGADVTLASPKGGQPPLDPRSDEPDSQTDATRRFRADEEAQAKLANTEKLANVSAGDFDTVFYPGGHGPMWDLPDNPDSIALLEGFLADDKPIAAVCHAPAALVNVRAQDGSYLVADRHVTGFADEEEAGVGLTDVVPFLLEDRLADRGAVYARSKAWGPHVEVDGRLVTGQNPASSTGTAERLLEMLRA
jgi:putative intracellular protease/amidase